MIKRIYPLIIALCTISNLVLFSPQVYAWSSDGFNNVGTNTHYWLLDSAIRILERDAGNHVTQEEVNLLKEWKEWLGRGISLADYNIFLTAVFSYGNHFYDPDTGKSFVPTKTAKDMGIHYFNKAGKTYKENHPLRAFYYLGLSCHYLTDVTQPMHAALFTNISPEAPCFHSKFEDLATSIHYKYTIQDGDAYWGWQGENPGDWIHQAAVDSKKDFSEIYFPEVKKWMWKSIYNPAYTRRWQDAAVPVIEKRLTEAQRILAGYIHLWLKTYNR